MGMIIWGETNIVGLDRNDGTHMNIVLGGEAGGVVEMSPRKKSPESRLKEAGKRLPQSRENVNEIINSLGGDSLSYLFPRQEEYHS